MKLKLALLAAMFATSGAQMAQADPLFVTGSTFQVQAQNSPDSFTNTVNLAAGTYSLDGGAVSLKLSIVPASGGAEWLVFNYSTTSGGAFGVQGQNWSLNQVGIDAAVPLNFIAAYSQFNKDGTALVPTSSIFGGYSVATNPVPGETGTGLGNSGFVGPIPAGPAGALGAFINPWNFLNNTGIDSTQVNGYEQALEFVPQVASVPEPSTWAMLVLGFAGIGFMAYRRKLTGPKLRLA
jgi:hypothetical protein